MYTDRLANYQSIEELRDSKLLIYITGDKPNAQTQIHHEALDFIYDHIDTFNLPRKISLYLYSRGGETLAGWTLVNIIRQFCDDFEVIVPSKALSTATLICLGADNIIMTKQAVLGPIDPSINGPLNPQVPGAPPNARIPISVEAVAGYIELAKSENINSEKELAAIFSKLADSVHPIALGNVFRARAQIQRLAKKLLSYHMDDNEIIENIISVLCSESGSHDYTISRREAQNELQLPIEKPDERLYSIIKAIQDDIRQELELNSAFNPEILLGTDTAKEYTLTRGLIESVSGGSAKYITEGMLTRQQIVTHTGTVQGVQDLRRFEGWKKDN